MISNAKIRKRARAVLGNAIFKSEWLYPLLLLLGMSVISTFLAWTGIGSLVFYICYGVPMCYIASYFVGRVRENIDEKDLGAPLDSVKKDVGGIIITGLLCNIFTFLWSMLFVIPGIVKEYSYALTYYIKIDNPNISPTEAITESRRLMKGHKMKLFMLDLSFIGWMFVGILCFGIGALWVAPYMEMSRAVFYEELVKANSSDQSTDAV